MHEMSYMIRLINTADEAVSDTPGRISSLSVEVGELTGVLPEYLEKYFPQASAGTRFEGADFTVIPIPAQALCLDCDSTFHPSRDNDYRCPSCGSINSRFLKGRELSVGEIKIEDD